MIVSRVNLVGAASAFIGSIFVCLVWVLIADEWSVLADGVHYMKMYEGEVADSPFGYRVLAPLIASLLPFSAKESFAVVTVSALALTASLLWLYAADQGLSLLGRAVAVLFWLTSFPFIYYGTTFIRADAIMYLVIALVFVLSRQKVSFILLMCLVAIGTLAHEMVLIVVPALWLDRVFGGSLTGGKSYTFRDLSIILVGALVFYVVSRNVVEVGVPDVPTYLKDPLQMALYAIEYSGGILNHILRSYAAFGPAFIFSFLYVLFFRREIPDVIVYLLLVVMVFGATFLATDTLRVMGILFVPVVVYSASFVWFIWGIGARIPAIGLVVLQVGYSSVVYLNLQTFEGSQGLYVAAAMISVAALFLGGAAALRYGGLGGRYHLEEIPKG